MGSQSVAKTIFLLVSMVGWLIVGAALMYLSPFLVDQFVSSDQTHLWMKNLGRGGYNPTLAWIVGGITLSVNVFGYFFWNPRFEQPD
jgi:hypothetical protein